MKKSWFLLLLPVLLLLWWGVGRGNSVPVVHFAQVQTTTIESTVSTNGKAEPAQWAAARAQIAGVVTSVSAHRGDDVQAGETVVSLDTAASQTALATAEAQQQSASADLATLKQGGKAAQRATIEDQIRAAQTSVEIGQRNYDAMQRLNAQQAATKLQVQDAKDALERARLQLQSAQNQQQALVTGSDREVAQARLRDAQAAVSLARHQLTLGTIKAPVSGTLYQFDLKVGAYLQAGDLVGLIGNLNQMKVIVYVDEPDLGRIGLGMPVDVTWDAHPGQKWWGKVDHMPTEVVALGSRTVGEVSTIIDNPNRDLLPGVSVNAVVTSKLVQNAVSIPKAALRNQRGSDGVYRLNGNQLQWTVVKPGVSDINNVQIASGIQVGDRVADRVIEPNDAELKNGMRIKPVLE
jgi:RND family efflux transporter MFP subunit